MKNTITVNTENLRKSVQAAEPFTYAKNSDFDGKLVFSGENGKLTIKATDYQNTLEVNDLPYKPEESVISFCVEAKKLLTALKVVKSEDIKIVIENDKITLVNGRSRVKIDTLALIPVINLQEEGDSFDFGDNIAKLETVLHSIDSNSPRYEINGALIEVKDNKMMAVGTDTKRMAVATSNVTLENRQFIIPKQGVQTIIKLFKGFRVTAKISETALTIHSGHVHYETKLINGKYPSWRRIIPSQLKTLVSLNKDKFKEVVREASIYQDEIVINFQKNKVLVSDQQGNVTVEEQINNEAEVKFSMNAKFIIDILNATKAENIHLAIDEPTLPVVFKTDDSFMEIVMPLISKEVQEEQPAAA